MEKATIIIGEIESGKSLTARLLTKDYKKEEVVWIAGRGFKLHPFAFEQCTLDTKCIVIDDLSSLTHFDFLVMSVHGVVVNKKYQHPFEINPKIILSFEEGITKKDFKDLGASFSRRIEIVECQKENLNELIQSVS